MSSRTKLEQLQQGNFYEVDYVYITPPDGKRLYTIRRIYGEHK